MSATHPGSSPLNPLFRTLHEQQFEDLCEIDQNTFVPSSTFRSSSSGSLSQLDYIWTSPAFPIPFLWASVFEVSDSFPTDHFLIIVHFDFLVLHSRRAPSYIKQRQQCRTCFDYYSATLAQKEAFVTEVSSFLSASPSNLFTNSLNRAGHQFKTALLSAGRTHFPKKTISLMKPKAILHELQPYIHLSHSLDHFTISLKKFTSIPSLSAAWSRFFIDFEDAFNGLFLNHSGLINGLPLPEQLVTIFDSSRLTYKEFLNQLHRSLLDTPNCPKLLVAPEEIKDAAISHFQNVVGPSVFLFDSLSSFPPRWQKRYSPLEQFHESLYDPVMSHISLSELREVISLSPAHKAPDLLDIPEDWRCASIAPIPKPHEFNALLKNTRPITLLETARKLLVKIINNRLSNILSTHCVLQGNNFAGLPGSSVNIPINVLDGIIKSHRLSQSSQELWILSQDISKAFDSINLRMLYLAFDRLRFPKNLSKFIISLFTNRKNRIFTPYGLTSPYNVLIGIDQGEVISPLLWTIYFDLLLTELSYSAISPYLWSSNIPKDILLYGNNEHEDLIIPVTQLTYMDDSTLISALLDGLQHLLSIARDFYFINNITANFSKYELLTLMKLSSSFRFLGVWFNLQGSPSFVISQIKDIYKAFISTVRFKKLAPNQLAYLHSAVILPKIHFRSQVTYILEATLTRIVRPYFGLQKKLLSLSRTFPSIAFSSSLFNEDTNPYTYLCQRLISRLMAWISLYTSGSVYSEWIIISFRTLQRVLKWPSSLDKISEFSKWNSSQRSIHHNWIFQTLRILSESGLELTFPNDLCLNLLPSHSIPLVSLSPELANSEKATWLFSKLCSQNGKDSFLVYPPSELA
ncbi:unnamed protein product [Rhizophagus irregularis]|nr:unnamed protein product [Rhizophagus irregularis]